MRACAHRTPHTAHRTPHAAHRTPHTARRTPHAARRTPHAAQRAGDGGCGWGWGMGDGDGRATRLQKLRKSCSPTSIAAASRIAVMSMSRRAKKYLYVRCVAEYLWAVSHGRWEVGEGSVAGWGGGMPGGEAVGHRSPRGDSDVWREQPVERVGVVELAIHRELCHLRPAIAPRSRDLSQVAEHWSGAASRPPDPAHSHPCRSGHLGRSRMMSGRQSGAPSRRQRKGAPPLCAACRAAKRSHGTVRRCTQSAVPHASAHMLTGQTAVPRVSPCLRPPCPPSPYLACLSPQWSYPPSHPPSHPPIWPVPSVPYDSLPLAWTANSVATARQDHPVVQSLLTLPPGPPRGLLGVAPRPRSAPV